MKYAAEVTEHGAATIVSAIGSLYGVAMGVSLKTRAKVSMTDDGGNALEIDAGEGMDHRLVRECVRQARLNGMANGSLSVSIETQIPPAKGMKSSSSVSLAVIGAIASCSGREMSSTELLHMSARASVGAGVSITGAFDDAAACHYGGIVFASNRGMRVLRRLELKDGYGVHFCIPGRSISKESLPMDEIRRHSAEMKGMYRKALSGKFRDACMSNTLLLCSLLDIDPAPALDAAGSGALLSGLTGTGPAFFALADRERSEEVVSALSPYGRIITTVPRGVSSDGIAF